MRYSDDPGDRGVRRARNSPRSPRVSKDPGERKQEIIETALELLAEKGYHELNVQDITDRMINRIFEFTKKHDEFEARYSEGEDIRSIYLDHVAEQWTLVLLPVVEQGVKEDIFHCTDASAATYFLIFGLIHTFHRNMPSQNTGEYMTSYLDFTHEMFARVLGIPADSFH